MSTPTEERARAAELPRGDIIGILLEQHARIQELFVRVTDSRGAARQSAFDELRELLAVHETGEEMVLRPVSKNTAGTEVANARNHEEDEATHMLARLERMDVNTAEFDQRFAEFQRSVLEHAQNEEREEFPAILRDCSDEQRASMGTRLNSAERLAPTHPHPSAAGSPTAQRTVGPFASLVDKVRDTISGS